MKKADVILVDEIVSPGVLEVANKSMAHLAFSTGVC